MQQRLEQFDMLKGIGIILVLLGHLPTGENSHMLINTFHMPLFFFCSGFFYKKRSAREELKRNVKSLIIPYVFFDVVLLSTCICIRMIHNHNLIAVLNDMAINPLDRNCGPLYLSIWFLLCMFFVRELYNTLCTSKILTTTFLMGGLYILAQLLHYQNIEVPFFIDSALGMAIFYAIGNLFHQSKLYKNNVDWYYCLIMLVFYFGVMEFIQPYVSVKENNYPWFVVFTSLIPIVSLYYLSKCLCKRNNIAINFLKLCGECALFIFALHRPIFEILYIILGKLEFSDTLNTIILLCVTIPLCVVAKYVINRYSPYLIGKF